MRARAWRDPGGSDSAARWCKISSMISCEISRTITVLVVVEVGCFTIDDFEPIGGVSHKWNCKTGRVFLPGACAVTTVLRLKVRLPETVIDE